MLPSRLRLRQRSLFARVYTKGRSYRTDLVVVYVLPSNGRASRVGFSVSKKLGGGVARNRTRRVLQEATRQLVPLIADGYDVVVVARSRAAEASYWDVLEALKLAFRKAGVLEHA